METKIEVGLSWAQLILNMYVFDGSLIVWAELIFTPSLSFFFWGALRLSCWFEKTLCFQFEPRSIYDFFLLKKRERLRLYALFSLVYSELCIQIDIIPLHLRCKAQEILHTTWIKLSNRQNSTVSNGRLFLIYPKQSSIILEESHKCAVLSRSHNPKNEKRRKRN
jgi:hypothetical protein